MSNGVTGYTIWLLLQAFLLGANLVKYHLFMMPIKYVL